MPRQNAKRRSGTPLTRGGCRLPRPTGLAPSCQLERHARTRTADHAEWSRELLLTGSTLEVARHASRTSPTSLDPGLAWAEGQGRAMPSDITPGEGMGSDSDACRPPVPRRCRPPFRFDVGHRSEMKPATL